MPAYLSRHEARAAYKHAASALANGFNAHYRTTGAALVAQYMSLPAPLEDMPAWVAEEALRAEREKEAARALAVKRERVEAQSAIDAAVGAKDLQIKVA